MVFINSRVSGHRVASSFPVCIRKTRGYFTLRRWNSFWRWLLSKTSLKYFRHGEAWIKYRTWISYLEIKHNDTCHLMDLGCGIGGHCFWFVKRFRGLQVIGLDIQEHVIKQAKKKNEDSQEYVFFLIGSVTNLPIRDNSFPKAISTQVFEHLSTPNDKLMLKEVHRILRIGSYFILNIPGPAFYTYSFPLYKIISWALPQLKKKNKTLRHFHKKGEYDSWGLHNHVRPGFYPRDVLHKLPKGLRLTQYKHLMKHFGALWFEFISLDRIFRKILLPFSYIMFLIDERLPGFGLDLTVQIQKISES